MGPRDISRLRLAWVLAILAVIPDVDIVGFHFGIAYHDPLGHRGFTHSILFAAVVAAITPSLAFPRIATFSQTRFFLTIFMFIATISHGVLDAFTDAGLGVGFLIPFNDARYFAPWRPIATSPLSITAFISGPAVRILANEFIWVGLPLAAIVSSWHVVRHIGNRRGVQRCSSRH